MLNRKTTSEFNAAILVVRFSALGDVVLSLPSVDYLCEVGFSVHVLTKEPFAPLYVALNRKNLVLHTITENASLAELLAKAVGLKTFRYAAVLDIHRNLRSRIFCLIFWMLTESPRFFVVKKPRIKEWLLFTLRQRWFLKFFSPLAPRWESSLRLATTLAKEISGVSGQAEFLTPNVVVEKSRSELYLRTLPTNSTSISGFQRVSLIGICVESAWKEKQWSEKKYLDLATKLTADGFTVVWLGLKSAKPFSERVSTSIDLTEKHSILETAAILKNLSLLVCNDAGLMHVAEAVGTPVVGVFGPTVPAIGFAPRLRNSRVVQSDLWCRPCSKTGRLCFRGKRKQLCLELISVDAVYRVTKEVLANASFGNLTHRASAHTESST